MYKNKYIEVLNNTMKTLGLMDICRTPHSIIIKEYTYFSMSHGTFVNIGSYTDPQSKF